MGRRAAAAVAATVLSSVRAALPHHSASRLLEGKNSAAACRWLGWQTWHHCRAGTVGAKRLEPSLCRRPPRAQRLRPGALLPACFRPRLRPGDLSGDAGWRGCRQPAGSPTAGPTQKAAAVLVFLVPLQDLASYWLSKAPGNPEALQAAKKAHLPSSSVLWLSHLLPGEVLHGCAV